MPLTPDEALDLGPEALEAGDETEDAIRAIRVAMRRDSDGGKRITKDEAKTILREGGQAIKSLGKLIAAVLAALAT